MSGFVVWMTGLSGAGKSTLASLLTQELSLRGVHVECLDGDEVRKNLSHGLGFSREDRDRNVRRIGYVARMVARSGACSITAAISPYKALREEIRSKTENFLEVYCECPLDVLTERDPKGLYKRALAGEIKNFTGVDDPYEAPENPEVRVQTDKSSPQECVQQIVSVVEEKGLITSPHVDRSVLPPPFGGEVFEAREAPAEEFAAARTSVEVDDVVAANIMAVCAGFFSPVSGFMSEREATKVAKEAALESGTPWWGEPFVLPLPSGTREPEPGDPIRVTHDGAPLALTRVDRVWGEAGSRYIAGPLDAISSGAGKRTSASSIRKRARQERWSHISCLFAPRVPAKGTYPSVAAAEALTDGTVLAVPRTTLSAWQTVVENDFPHVVLVELPDDFPMDNERARLVVQKAVGAFASLFLE